MNSLVIKTLQKILQFKTKILTSGLKINSKTSSQWLQTRSKTFRNWTWVFSRPEALILRLQDRRKDIHLMASFPGQPDNNASTPSVNYFTGQILFLMTNQQCRSTEGKYRDHKTGSVKSWEHAQVLNRWRNGCYTTLYVYVPHVRGCCDNVPVRQSIVHSLWAPRLLTQWQVSTLCLVLWSLTMSASVDTPVVQLGSD